MTRGWPKTMPPPLQRSARHGVTLLEVLVVVTIMLILLAVMVPRLRPMMEQRRIREASRIASGVFYAARSRAMETGRPVGVALERLPSQPEACITLKIVEEPPPYAGDILGAKARVRRLGNSSLYQVQFNPVEVANMLTQTLPVMVGDFITFESQGGPYRVAGRGIRYRVLGLDQNGDELPDGGPDDLLFKSTKFDSKIGDKDFFDKSYPVFDFRRAYPPSAVLLVELVDVAETPWPETPDARAPFPPAPNGIGSHPVSFQIYRQPESFGAMPARLPSGTVIDLASSGTDSMALQGAPPAFIPTDHDVATSEIEDRAPVVIVFSPDSRISRVIHDRQRIVVSRNGGRARVIERRQEAVTEPVYFLIGRWERMPAVASTPRGQPLAEDNLYNWQDLTNFWLVVNPNTGLAVVTPLSGDVLLPGTNIKVPSDLYISRNDARQMKGVGGR